MLHSVATAFATKVFPVPTNQQLSLVKTNMSSCTAAALDHVKKSDQTD